MNGNVEIRWMSESEARWAGNAPEAAGGLRVRVQAPSTVGTDWRLLAIGTYPSDRAIGDGKAVSRDAAIAYVAATILYAAPHCYGERPEALFAALEVLAPDLVPFARRYLSEKDREAGATLHRLADVKAHCGSGFAV